MLTWAYPAFASAALGLVLLLVLAGLQVQRTARLGQRLGQRVGRLAWKLPLRLVAGALLLLAWLGPALGVRSQATGRCVALDGRGRCDPNALAAHPGCSQ
jgi:Ca-activated chloride channel family protein